VAPDHRAAPGSFELGTDGPHAILVGVDGSPTSLRAAAYAAGLARRQCARLVVVHARASPGLLSMLDVTGVATHVLRDAQDELEAQLVTAVADWDRISEVDAHVVVRRGSPLRVLREVADEVRAEAVVVGSSAGLSHRIIGSLALRLIRARRWPVTVVP